MKEKVSSASLALQATNESTPFSISILILLIQTFQSFPKHIHNWWIITTSSSLVLFQNEYELFQGA